MSLDDFQKSVNSKQQRLQKNLETAQRIKKNREFYDRIGEDGVRRFIWNVEEGGYVHESRLLAPSIDPKPRHTKDPVYQTLAGVRGSIGKIRGQRLSLTQRSTLQLCDAVIRGLYHRIEQRQMTEDEYKTILYQPRCETYSRILLDVSKAFSGGQQQAGYEIKRFHQDEDFDNLRHAEKVAARSLESVFHIDLKEDYPLQTKMYTMKELEALEPTLARRAVILGRIKL